MRKEVVGNAWKDIDPVDEGVPIHSSFLSSLLSFSCPSLLNQFSYGWDIRDGT